MIGSLLILVDFSFLVRRILSKIDSRTCDNLLSLFRIFVYTAILDSLTVSLSRNMMIASWWLSINSAICVDSVPPFSLVFDLFKMHLQECVSMIMATVPLSQYVLGIVYAFQRCICFVVSYECI